MAGEIQDTTIPHKPDKFDAPMSERHEEYSMGKEDRKMRVLRVLVDSELALPVVVIFRNAKLRGADFERNSTDNYLRELYDEGLVKKVEPEALESERIKEICTSQEGYFIATEAGHERLS